MAEPRGGRVGTGPRVWAANQCGTLGSVVPICSCCASWLSCVPYPLSVAVAQPLSDPWLTLLCSQSLAHSRCLV